MCMLRLHTTLSAIIRINWISVEQSKIAVILKIIHTTEISCCELQSREPVKGVLSGVTMKINIEYMKRISGVVGVRRLTHWVIGKKIRKSVVLFYLFIKSTYLRM